MNQALEGDTGRSGRLRKAIGVLLFLNLLVVGMIGGVFLLDRPEKVPSGTPVDSEVEELFLLEDYMRRNTLFLPPEYGSAKTVREKVLALRKEVTRREVTWRSGAYVFVSPVGEPGRDPEGYSQNRELARQKIGEYQGRALRGEKIEVLVEEIINDESLVSGGGVMQFLAVTFKEQTPDRLAYAEEYGQFLVYLKEGEVSPVLDLKSPPGLIFFVITKRHDGRFGTYAEWLRQESGGMLE